MTNLMSLLSASSFWSRLSLANRFALVSGMVFVIATLIIGLFIVDRIEESVVRNSANATAHYMDSVLSPISDQLAETGTLSPGARRALDEIFDNTSMGDRVASYKIWSADGTVIAASDKSLEGQKFEMTENLTQAWAGEVMADFEELGDAEDIGEARLGLPLLEIYSPIHEAWSGKTAAVAEFYEINEQLRQDLDEARLGTWTTVSAVSLGLGLILYTIVLGGSHTIDTQRVALDAKLDEVRKLSERNRELRLRVQSAAGRAAASQEETMRRIGADLHDGPAQDLAFAALRLDSLQNKIANSNDQEELRAVKGAIDNALNEVRSLSRGLSLPQISRLALDEIVTRVVETHRLRSGQSAELIVECDPAFPLTEAIRICVFRFVQEAMNNASRHAAGHKVIVQLTCSDTNLRLTVQDDGPGFDKDPDIAGHDTRKGLGLIGLRDRVESLGGVFSAENAPEGGAVLTMTLETGS